ncbi:alpha/beta fold hydrolase [Pseudomonas reactans]|nr:alpha/beta fold hydrolase [Pseudomonas reactans]
MFGRLSSFLLLWVCLTQVVSAASQVGFRETTLGETSPRPLHIAMWYPTQQTQPVTLVGDNPAFVGLAVIRDASPQVGSHPLVVLSHGYRGNWRNLNWLAGDLAAQGYIVAAPDHPGTTTMDQSPEKAAQMWLRPQDLSRTIDALLASAEWVGKVDSQRIAAVGHSLGGWTVAELAGARFDTAQFVKDCQPAPQTRICSLMAEMGINRSPQFTQLLDADWRDPRVKAVVSLDLGFARGFSKPSLAAIKVPFLVLSAGTNIAELPAARESAYLAAGLPASSSRYMNLNDASHFSFMQQCKPGGEALIEEGAPGDGIICHDGAGRSRQVIHQQVAQLIAEFLAQAVPVH